MGTVEYDEAYRAARLQSIDGEIEANKIAADALTEQRKRYAPTRKAQAPKPAADKS